MSSNIAILGSSGHIGQNLIHYFSQNDYNLYLFTRNPDNLRKIVNYLPQQSSYQICSYDSFNEINFDMIANCIGMNDVDNLNSAYTMMEVTNQYDDKIIKYLEKKPFAVYINMSSGSVYGNNFIDPVTDSSKTILDINNPGLGHYYSAAKVWIESKHRSMPKLNIVDLRIFSFFSRFLDINNNFLMSKIVSAVIKNEKLLVDNNDIVRDFVHPSDLFSLIEKCMKTKENDYFDVYSSKPIPKFEILNTLTKKFGLQYETTNTLDFLSPTGLKPHYYSLSRKASKLGYVPKYHSLQTILDELEFIFTKYNY